MSSNKNVNEIKFKLLGEPCYDYLIKYSYLKVWGTLFIFIRYLILLFYDEIYMP